jgi:DNA-binding NtrC family response regulator
METQNPIFSGKRLLVVEDDPIERKSLSRLLMRAGFQVSAAESADKALSYLDEKIDFVLSDQQMGDVSGMDLLKHWHAKQPETMFLMVTGHGNTETAIEAIKSGAYDYLTKPLDIDKLLVSLKNMLRHREESSRVKDLQHRLNGKFSLSSIIGRTPEMERVFELIRRSANAFSTVLILGESGTGKELVAQAIHQNSPRKDGPFIAVNCAAMPAPLVESELFGHEKGAFTGAHERRTGRFEAAAGGTLFIDEIGDFDLTLQVKLLRVLEARTVTPVGGNNEMKVDTRVLTATSRDVRRMMAEGKFREDLYYRLNVITIELPPLRKRIDDIPILVKQFMDRVNEANGTSVTAVTPAVIEALQHYHWPGNVRELLNVVESMMVLSDKSTLDVDDLPNSVLHPENSVSVSVPSAVAPAHAPASSQNAALAVDPNKSLDQALETMTLDELEAYAIGAALQRFGNNRTRAARALGISVRTLQRKLGVKHAQEAEEPETTPT